MGACTGRRAWATGLGIGLLLSLAGCEQGGTEGVQPPERRKDVTAVAVLDGAGRRSTLADHRGKVVLVDVWATWCPPCRKALPEIAELQKRADGRYAVLAISVDKGGFPEVEPFLRANPSLGLQAVVPDGSKGLEPFGSIRGIPTTLVIDRQGRLRERWSGFYEGRPGQALQAALAEP